MFSLVSYLEGDRTVAGIAIEDRVVSLELSMLEVLERWETLSPTLEARARCTSRPRAGVQLVAPIPNPTSIYGSGANYTDHLEEMSRGLGMEIPSPKKVGQPPWHFVKTARAAVAGPDQIIELPAYGAKVDWEIELAVVIGKRAKEVRVEDALAYVAGYTIANDLSARDHVKRAGLPPDSPFAFDWVSQKCFDGSCPLGPGIVPAAFVPDPQALAMELSVNGVTMQRSSTAQMIYSCAEQLAYLSSRLTLFPGDIILTGTPAGVGMARGHFLVDGDAMRLSIEGLGVLENRVRRATV